MTPKEQKSTGKPAKRSKNPSPIGTNEKILSNQPSFAKSPGKKQSDSIPNKIFLDDGVWLQKVKVTDLKPNSWNPNEMSEQMFSRLKERISKVGFRDPILCTPDLVITDGEHRWKALQDVGKTETWVIVADESEEDAMIETSTSNLIRGEFNPIKYGQYLTDLLKTYSIEDLADLIPTPKMQIEALTQLVADLPKYSSEDLQNMISVQKWVIKLEFGSETDYKEAEESIKRIMKAEGHTSNASTILYLTRRFYEV